MPDLVETDGTITLSIRVVPRASRTEIAGFHDGALRVRVAAPPVDGAANEELVRGLAKLLEVPPREVEILRGHTGRVKQVRLPARCAAKLRALAGKPGSD